jgi:hypothetical protein
MIHAALQTPRPTYEDGEILPIETPKVQLHQVADDRQFGSRRSLPFINDLISGVPSKQTVEDGASSAAIYRTTQCCRMSLG